MALKDKNLKELGHSYTFVFFFCFVFASGFTQNFQRAEYSWAASYSVTRKNKLFPAGLEPTTFRV